MLKHIRRVGNVEGAIAEGQRGATGLDCARRWGPTVQPHLPRICIHGDIRRSTCAEGVREESGAAPHVEQACSGKRLEAVHVSCGVRSQVPVEAIGIRLLHEEGPEEAHGSAPRGGEGAGARDSGGP